MANRMSTPAMRSSKSTHLEQSSWVQVNASTSLGSFLRLAAAAASADEDEEEVDKVGKVEDEEEKEGNVEREEEAKRRGSGLAPKRGGAAMGASPAAKREAAGATNRRSIRRRGRAGKRG